MSTRLTAVLQRLDEVVLDKSHTLRLALTCLLARGHLLLEDLPGMGKTTLSHALAKTLGLGFKRIQFTADILPGDILGTSVFDARSASFSFHPGPIFTELVLADEINRATAKSQSALLEAMEEGQVTVDGTTYKLPSPFFVIATQNPQHQSGTYPLPESQLDRFMMRLSLGYPALAAEKALLLGQERRELLKTIEPLLTQTELLTLQAEVKAVNVSDALVDYLLRLVTESRAHAREGLSPRASLALLSAAKGWAYLAGRDYVIPEDVQAVFVAVAGHRLRDLGLCQRLLAEVSVF